jgi:hypothetical protein
MPSDKEAFISLVTNLVGKPDQKGNFKFINFLGTICRIKIGKLTWNYERKSMDLWFRMRGAYYTAADSPELITKILQGAKPYEKKTEK